MLVERAEQALHLGLLGIEVGGLLQRRDAHVGDGDPIVVDTDERGARLVEANLYKLLPVRRVDNITRVPTIARDLAMIKVSATGDARTQVMQLVDVYRARIVDVSPETLVIETTGTEDKIDSLLEVLRPYGVIEMVRTGRVEMARGTSQAVTVAPSRGIGDGPTRQKDGGALSV